MACEKCRNGFVPTLNTLDVFGSTKNPPMMICGSCDEGRRIAVSLPALIDWWHGIPKPSAKPPEPPPSPADRRLRAAVEGKLREETDPKTREVFERFLSPEPPPVSLAEKRSAADVLDDALAAMYVGTDYRAFNSHRDRVTKEAWEAWRGERNASANLRESLYRHDSPNLTKITRYLLDVLTGGALSSLIATVHDTVMPHFGNGSVVTSAHDLRENLRENLRALGEHVE